MPSVERHLKSGIDVVGWLTTISKFKFHILIITGLVLVTRVGFFCSPAGRIGDADEAVFGMMAQAIGSMKEFPLYCWEAQYAGTLVSYIAALIFHFFGSGFIQLRLAMLPAAIITCVLYYHILRKLFGPNEALVGGLFLVFCPYLVLHNTMAAYGGYGETYLGTCLIILLSWKTHQMNSTGKSLYLTFILGLVCGFFFYLLFLVLPAIIAFAVSSIWKLEKKRKLSMFFYLCGCLIGSAPMIAHNIIVPSGTLLRAAGRAFNVGRESAVTAPVELLQQIFLQKLLYLRSWLSIAPDMLGNYLMPETFGIWNLKIAGIGLIIILGYFMIWALRNKRDAEEKSWYLKQFAMFGIYLIIFQWVANLDQPRHLLPLLMIIPVAIFALGENQNISKRAIMSLLVLMCGLQAVGWLEMGKRSLFDPAPLVVLMKEKGINTFYGSYWTTYPIMFASKGDIIGSPSLLPYDEIFSDRRPKLSQQVRRSNSPAFLFAAGEVRLREAFTKFLLENSIAAEKAIKNGTTIYYDISKPVHAAVESHRKTRFIAE